MSVDEVDTLVQFASVAGWCLGLPMGFVLGLLVHSRPPSSELAAHDAPTMRKRGVL